MYVRTKNTEHSQWKRRPYELHEFCSIESFLYTLFIGGYIELLDLD